MPKNALDVQADIESGGWSDDCRLIAAAVLQTAYEVAAPEAVRKRACEVSVLFCNDETMRQINKNWRAKDNSTNVLSFPQNDDINVKNKPFCLGDIILAFETIVKEAGDKNIDVAEHLKHLIVHGFLHLVGYDHQDDAQAEAMEAMERKILTTTCHMQKQTRASL